VRSSATNLLGACSRSTNSIADPLFSDQQKIGFSQTFTTARLPSAVHQRTTEGMKPSIALCY